MYVAPNCHQKPCVKSMCMLLPQTVKVKEATSAVVLMTTDSMMKKRDFMTTTTPFSKSNSLDRKPLKEILNNCGKMLKCSSSQLAASGRVQDLVSLRV